ncbi:hypothetical protein BWQ96_04738 [Gracilariopsis chorda]|uniref:Uncharacterized protein n=1 Tax=Gracilariopsis chorda TaxID=448386 RepID=A0A2V3IWC9_9FLOR|nr:hypothetical protein BWQ96_04738 [Gracilariopsis chorda]|eukprot:PXF45440.1 hypothetical protein BWQ96_04738 [Gracilariopsis chorda]
MSRRVFSRIFAAVVNESDYIRKGLRSDAVGKMAILPLLEVVCALRQLSYGITANLSDNLFDVAESTAALCLEVFCQAVVRCYQDQYFRVPTAGDLERLEREFAAVGFLGCIECFDCAEWTWNHFSKALQGIMIRKNGVPTVRMEAIWSLDLGIWAFRYGLPRVMNDLNILVVSNYLHSIIA